MFASESIAERLQRLFGTSQPVAWLTGSGAPRVGQHVARHLAARGYRIVVHARSSIEQANSFAEQLKASGCESIVVVGDITKEEQVTSIVEQIQCKMGRLDLLVNSAAIWDPMPLEQVDSHELRRNFETNVLGSFLCAQKAGLLMAGQENGGAIIQIGDWSVVRPYRGYSAYFTGKGAIETMTASLAVELANRNRRIRVNALLPGPILLPDEMGAQERQALAKQSLLHREGRPDHLADGVIFLAEAEFVTGVSIPIDGGRTIYSGDSLDHSAHPSMVGDNQSQ